MEEKIESAVAALQAELEVVKKERDSLLRELEVVQSFHSIAVKERDLERLAVNSLHLDLERTQKPLDLEAKFAMCGRPGCRAVSERVSDSFCKSCLSILSKRSGK